MVELITTGNLHFSAGNVLLISL